MRFSTIIILAFALVGSGGSSRLRATASASKNLDTVVTLLLKMMEDFRGQAGSDKDAWEGYQAWSEEQETDKTGYMQEQ